MNVVSSAESDVLVVARALFDPRNHAVVAPLIRTERVIGKSLGRTAMKLLEDILAKGAAHHLARSGAFVRVWERVESPLHFSAASFLVLHWLVATPLAAPAVPSLDPCTLTVADELVIVAAAEMARTAGVIATVMAQPLFRGSTLLALHALDDFARTKAPIPDLSTCTHGDRLQISIALNAPLTARWRRIEADKAALTDPAMMAAIGRAQGEVLAPLVDAITPDRLPALQFLLDAALHQRSTRLPVLDPNATLGARVEARRLAVAPLRAIGKIAEARERYRLTGFVDDGYEEAQRALTFLEPWTDLFARAESAVAAADALEEPS